ncbi:unnamed protein product [Effrenium voratum]|nr:unnamed protein product [Effrenium voratum]
MLQLTGWTWISGWRLASAAFSSVFGVATVWLFRRHSLVWRRHARRCNDAEVLSGVEDVCMRYGLTKEGGFLPAACLDRLPKEFDAWEAVASELPRLNRSGRLAARLEALPQLDVANLKPEELRRAYVLLGSLAHSYVHRQAVPWHKLDDPTSGEDGRVPQHKARLPRQVSEPWLQVCQQLGMPPVLTAAGTDLWNWRLRDTSKPFEPANLEQRITVTGSGSERVFHMVPCAMQAAAAEVVPKIFLADVLVRKGRQETSLLPCCLRWQMSSESSSASLSRSQQVLTRTSSTMCTGLC